MRILLIGAGGFIGRRLAARLREAGHTVLAPGRATADLRRADTDWPELLRDVDVVVNAAGILRGDLAAIHHHGPARLFEACAAAGIHRVVQVSALGAATNADTEFLRSKGAADARLLELRQQGARHGWAVARPGLVVGRGGASTALFAGLAALPWPVRLGPGSWPVQPLHVADLVAAIQRLLEAPLPLPEALDLVGPEPMGIAAFTAELRRWLGLPERRFLPLPTPLLRLAALGGALAPASPLTPAMLSMLERGSVADPAPAATALGWRARPLREALASEPAVAADRWHARLHPLRPLLLSAMAALWLASGLVPLLATPPEVNAALLAGLGLHGAAAAATLWAGALADIAIGLGLLLRPRPAALAGLVVMAGFTVLASFAEPALWLHPFAPLLKNLAVATALLVLLAMEE
jgi:uncharacterized protein YbjT (DUF2867 family)